MDMERDHPLDASAALEDVIDQTVSLFHLLRALAERLHDEGELSAGRRGILRGLDRLGPQTVPQMARARPVSRQYVQMLVNDLEAEGLVELAENAAHKRSRLVRLTPRGKAALAAMYEREATFYATLDLGLPAETLQASADTLRALRDALLQAQLRQARTCDASLQHEHASTSESERLSR
jgi:DNA-binding MarR family transcriptional regulator